MDCDPKSLMAAAKCYRCIPKGELVAVITYLLCSWAKKKQGGGPNKAVLVYPASPGGSPNPINPILRWSNGGGATSYNVWFNGVLIGNQVGTTYSPGLLLGTTNYTWQIDSVGPGGTTTGDTWSFTTLDLFSFNGSTIQWTDAVAGTVTGTLAQLYALGNGDSLSAIDTQATGALVSFTNLDSLPALASLVADNEPNLNTLDISNCLSLQTCSAFNVLPAGISSLDATNCVSLTSLICHDNPLATLTLTNCTGLQHLECQFTSLGSLNVSDSNGLIYLDCSGCSISSLDVTNCTPIGYIDCSSQSLSSLIGVAGKLALGFLICGPNALLSLNVSGCVALTLLNCGDNQLIALDASTCVSLSLLICPNQFLTDLRIGTSTAYIDVEAQNNALPKTPNGVDDVIDALFANCLANGGIMDLDTAATNATPSAPQQAKWATMQLPANGWIGNIN